MQPYIYTKGGERRRSPTINVPLYAKYLTDLGHEIYHFGGGQMFETPSENDLLEWRIRAEREAAVSQETRFMLSGCFQNRMHYGPNQGTPGLRAAAARHVSETYGFEETTANHIVVSSGSKGALNGALAMLKEGDVVAIPAPAWPTIYDIIPKDVTIIEVDTHGTGLLAPGQVTYLFHHYPDLRAMILNVPNNPTGANYDPIEREEVLSLIRYLAGPNFHLYLDDPYSLLDYGHGHSLKRGAAERHLFADGRMTMLQSVSKCFGLPGDRVGYAVSMNPLVLEEVLMHNDRVGTVASNAAQDEAQLALLYGPECYVPKSLEALRTNASKLQEWAGGIAGMALPATSAAIYAMPDFSAWRGARIPAYTMLNQERPETLDSPEKLRRLLAEAAGFNAVPGGMFYAPGSPAGEDNWSFRICLSDSLAKLDRAFNRIEALSCHLELRGRGRG